MKCKTCGKTARSLAAMAAHYRKAHPSKMKRKPQPTVRKTTKTSSPGQRKEESYCSKCGARL